MQLERAALVERITPLFQENFAIRGELGAAVSVWHDGEPVLDLYGGFQDANRTIPWACDTMVLFWSATKGLGAACVLHALEKENSSALHVTREDFYILINVFRFALMDIMAIFHLSRVPNVMKVAQNAPVVLLMNAPPVKEATFWLILHA